MGRKAKTTEQFIIDAKITHGDKYDYSSVVYINSKNKVEIICHKNNHGSFWQSPGKHIAGNGCIPCFIEDQTGNLKSFIKKSKKKYEKDNYDYSLSVYIKAIIPLQLRCKIHNEIFWISPNKHFGGAGGCKECGKLGRSQNRTGKTKTGNTKDFVKRSKKIHKGKGYKYNLVIYVNNHTPVKIICPKHNIFEQTPASHLAGKGCRGCRSDAIAEANRYTLQEFVEAANKIHNNKYEYKTPIYVVNGFSYIDIFCKEEGHGTFTKHLTNHLSGEQGCPICSNISRADSQRMSLDDFIKRSKAAHAPNKYNYDLVKYTTVGAKIKIICNIDNHGIFEQKAEKHLIGQEGCEKCAIKKMSDAQKKITTEMFIEKAKVVHKNKYDYSKSIYVSAKEKVIIICPIKDHGEFLQSPDNHLRKRGCPRCNTPIAQHEWLDTFKNPDIERHQRIVIDGRVFFPDGIDRDNKIIYEYHGDYWHGNPNTKRAADPKDINKINKQTFEELYLETIEREEYLIKYGYKIISITETKWLLHKKLQKYIAKANKDFHSWFISFIHNL